MRPTFGGINTAKSALNAARANLNITGNNMANVNTPGYTRQRIDLYSIGASGMRMRYQSRGDVAIGGGVNIGGVSQIRDPYLDVRYRSEHKKIGDSVAQLDSLKELEGVFDEIMKDGIDAQFNELHKQFQNLSSNPSSPLAESIVKTSASMLLKMFNSCSGQVDTIKKQQLSYLKDSAIKNANELISGISYLNKEIKSANISGNPALELLDQRNTMVDTLSQYFNLEVKTNIIDIGGGQKVEELDINLLVPGGEKFNIINNGNFREFKLQTDPNTGEVNEPIEIQLVNSDGSAVTMSESGAIGLEDSKITDLLFSGSFAGYAKMLNSKGEFDNPPTTERGVGYYENMLDTLVHDFADMFNKANSTNTSPPYEKPLFTSIDGGPINAGNIQISEKWQNATDSYITASKNPAEDGSTSNENIVAMIALFTEKHHFEASNTSTPLFTGSFQDCFTNISSTLSLELKEVDRQYTTFSDIISEVSDQRSSVSSVDLDAEGVNLIQYNQSLTAASRYMTTLDEALETIISRMGIVGR